jgi:hypothetical protein
MMPAGRPVGTLQRIAGEEESHSGQPGAQQDPRVVPARFNGRSQNTLLESNL